MPMEWINDRGLDKDVGCVGVWVCGCVYVCVYKKEICSNMVGPREYHSE